MNEPKNHVFLRSELRAILAGLAMAAAGTSSGDFADGFNAALLAVAVAVGLEDAPPMTQRTITVEQPRRARLAGGIR